MNVATFRPATAHLDFVAKLEAYLKTAREDTPDWPLFVAPASGRAAPNK